MGPGRRLRTARPQWAPAPAPVEAPSPAPTGNAAFDGYRDDADPRLEAEQTQFVAFLDRLRHARDAEEFNRFMKRRAPPPDPRGGTPPLRRPVPRGIPAPEPDNERPMQSTMTHPAGLPDPDYDAAFYDGVPAKRFFAWIVDVILIASDVAGPLALLTFGPCFFGSGRSST
jgi:hypothetical protein